MYCRNCGAPLHDSDAFCPKCGTKVIPPSGGAAKKETDSLLDKYRKNIEDSEHFTPTGTHPEYQQPSSESRQKDSSEHFTPDNGSAISADTIQPPPEEKEKKKQKMLKIILIVLAVILIIVIAVVSIMMGKKRADNEMAVPDKTASATTQIADENSDGDEGGQQRIVVQRKRPKSTKLDYKDPDHPKLSEYLKNCSKIYRRAIINAIKNNPNNSCIIIPEGISYDKNGNMIIQVFAYNGTSNSGILKLNNYKLFYVNNGNHLIAWGGVTFSNHRLDPDDVWEYSIILSENPIPKDRMDSPEIEAYSNLDGTQGFIQDLNTSKINKKYNGLYLSYDNSII